MRRRWITAISLAACTPRVADVGSTDDTDAPSTSESTPDADLGTIDPPNDCGQSGSCDAGCVVWERGYQGANGVADHIATVAVRPDGTVIAAGMRDWNQSADSGDAFVVAFDAAGEQLWDATPFGVDNGAQDEVLEIAVGADGTIAVLGQRCVDLETTSVLALIDDEIDAPLITSLGAGRLASAVMFASDGSLLIGGSGNPEVGTSSGFVERYAPDATKIQEWSGTEIDLDEGVVGAMASLSETVIALGGAWYNGVGSDAWLAVLDLEAGIVWSTTYRADAAMTQWATDVAVLPGDDLFVVGTYFDANANEVGWAERIGPDGSVRWTRAYEPDGCCSKRFVAVEVSNEGRVFVLAVRADQASEISLLELDCDGNIAWEWNHASPAWDQAYPGGLAWDASLGLVAGGLDYVTENDQRGYLVRFAP